MRSAKNKAEHSYIQIHMCMNKRGTFNNNMPILISKHKRYNIDN